MSNEDYLLALELQEEFNRELNYEEDRDIIPVELKKTKQAPKRRWSNDSNDEDLNCTNNLVHPEWETLDPTPDVNSMFLAFDNKFFQGRLKCVTLEWSKRMYSCAGICYSRRCRLGMSITIRLSEPLLKLRSRKDLVETLLHEMIHAYLFVLGIREENGGHGSNFKKIMHGINQVAGTNITVYHSFHDEVNLYKVHWWRCNGICQNRKPFFGFVKRTSNRAPGPNDNWWQQHFQSCGGTFLKIRGPEPKAKKIKKDSKLNGGVVLDKVPKNNLRNYFVTKDDGPSKNKKEFINSNNNTNKGPIKMNGGGTLLLNPKTKPSTITQPKPNEQLSSPTKSHTFGGNLRNVVSLNDLGDSESPKRPTNNSTKYEMTGTGYSLNQNTNRQSISNNHSETVDLTKLRDVWSKKYPTSPTVEQTTNLLSDPICIGSPEKLIDNNVGDEHKKISSIKKWTNVNQDNDDIIVLDEKPELICLSSDDDDDERTTNITNSPIPNSKPSQQERQTVIKQEIINYTDLLEDEIELIDDDFDDNLNVSSELADTSLVDDLFGDDTLLKDFRIENSVIPSSSRYHNDPRNDIVTCPICQEKIKRENLNEHLDGCIGITVKIDPNIKFGQMKKKEEERNKSKNFANVLKRAGYSNEDILKVINDEFIPLDRSINNNASSIQNNPTSSAVLNNSEIESTFEPLNSSMHDCPVCSKKVNNMEINDHLDNCLQNYVP